MADPEYEWGKHTHLVEYHNYNRIRDVEAGIRPGDVVTFEQLVASAETGPIGPTGPTGPSETGPTGPEGELGPTGPTGATGPQGVSAEPGNLSVISPVDRLIWTPDHIDALSDVDTGTTGPIVGEALTWNGTTWVPGTPVSVGQTPLAPCRAATDGAIDTALPPAVIDGVTLSNGDRLLVKDQADATQNGTYIYASPLTRSADVFIAGNITFIQEGAKSEGTTLMVSLLASEGPAWTVGESNLWYYVDSKLDLSPGAGLVANPSNPKSWDVNAGWGIQVNTGTDDVSVRISDLDSVYARTLYQLDDVDVVTQPPTDQQSLVFDQPTNKWVPGEAAVDPPVAGEGLYLEPTGNSFNVGAGTGVKVDKDAVSVDRSWLEGLIPRRLAQQLDVNVVGPPPAPGEVLTWDDASRRWVPRPAATEPPGAGQGLHLATGPQYDVSVGPGLRINMDDEVELDTAVTDGLYARQLAQLDDVDVHTTRPADGNSLTWSASGNMWVPGVASTVGSLDDLSDVTTVTGPTGPQDGQVLVWNGSIGQWIPGEAAVTVDSLDDLGDVDTGTTGPTDGQSLVWSESLGQWVPGSAVEEVIIDTVVPMVDWELWVDSSTGSMPVLPAGPQGPTGPTGPQGEQAVATTVLGSFGDVATPADLPPSGLIPIDFDGVGKPAVAYQMELAQSLYFDPADVNDPDKGHVFSWVSTTIDPLGWQDLGEIKGEQGEPGTIGVDGATGPTGPAGATPTGPYLPTAGGEMTGNISFAEDNEGIIFYGGARVTKKSGGGMYLRKPTSGVQWKIENNDGSGSADIATVGTGTNYTINWENSFSGSAEIRVTPSTVTVACGAIARSVTTPDNTSVRLFVWPSGVPAPWTQINSIVVIADATATAEGKGIAHMEAKSDGLYFKTFDTEMNANNHRIYGLSVTWAR